MCVYGCTAHRWFWPGQRHRPANASVFLGALRALSADGCVRLAPRPYTSTLASPDLQTVVGKANIFWQLGLGLGVGDVVCHVDEVGFFGGDLLGDLDGLVK